MDILDDMIKVEVMYRGIGRRGRVDLQWNEYHNADGSKLLAIVDKHHYVKRIISTGATKEEALQRAIQILQG